MLEYNHDAVEGIFEFGSYYISYDIAASAALDVLVLFDDFNDAELLVVALGNYGLDVLDAMHGDPMPREARMRRHLDTFIGLIGRHETGHKEMVLKRFNERLAEVSPPEGWARSKDHSDFPDEVIKRFKEWPYYRYLPPIKVEQENLMRVILPHKHPEGPHSDLYKKMWAFYEKRGEEEATDSQ